MAGMRKESVLRVRPTYEQFAWTFGGVPPLSRIEPESVLEVFTEDCYSGRVRSTRDLPSTVCRPPFRNPQTGPFFVESAKPGDTLALHFISIEPARDWAVSTTVPYFGALTSTHSSASLQPPLPEIVWIWQLDRVRQTCTHRPRQ